MICKKPNPECNFRTCKLCFDDATIRQILSDVFMKSNSDTVKFRQWVLKPRAILETRSQSVEDFISTFCTNAKDYLLHSFLANEQSNSYEEVKKI